ncbi:MBL fold metallo-hydrolase [Arcticibacter eurypsychrophilus]|uniref:MBL fold metallo-hydrolase n=1 Tax=Arcticibacter eurypsychrophilus TaxID=1434752 RepID=UPI00084E0AEC|nr:MBL fold metallo-hydrolase [Arcticibacter eurypsychrophilus]
MKLIEDNKFIPMTSVSSGSGKEVRSDIYYYTNHIVNIVMIGDPEGEDWFLVDTGMPFSGKEIIFITEERFGKGSKPKAIFLTHGHFDHVGGIVDLLEAWDVQVYAHLLEFPYLTGKKSYPDSDTSVEGGLLAKISSIYPYEPVDIGEVLLPLPHNGSVPGLPEWRWIAAPGHSPGQVVFFRERDKILLSADAFITVRQDSLYKVLIQKEEINGPPRYFTTDWQAAAETVKELASLNPELVISGHGQFMEGEELRAGLEILAYGFDKLAKPKYGKYVTDTDQELEHQ